jgi:peptidoglycan/xylan/chitin deacetylase (PgdA/CDA1 family)
VAKGYETLSLSRLAGHFREGRPLPERAVVLTFDDGWEEQFETAAPIVRRYGLRATFFVVTSYVGHREFLSWDQIRTLVSYGMAIGSHSRHHPDLAEISNADELRDEIETSKAIIERETGTSVDAFAYPYGAYNRKTIAAVERAGYTTARADRFGIMHAEADLYKLTVVTAPNDLEMFEEILAR